MNLNVVEMYGMVKNCYFYHYQENRKVVGLFL